MLDNHQQHKYFTFSCSLAEYTWHFLTLRVQLTSKGLSIFKNRSFVFFNRDSTREVFQREINTDATLGEHAPFHHKIGTDVKPVASGNVWSKEWLWRVCFLLIMKMFTKIW